VIGFREFHPATAGKGATIVTEFAGNGSLVNYLPVTNGEGLRGLRGPTRITRIIAGIALAMRYLHACGVVHHDLRPENILLDWDWSVTIADFGHSTSREAFDIPHSAGQYGAWWPSGDCRYSTLECFENDTGMKADVFSFGLILYENVAGKPVLPIDLERSATMRMLLVDHFRPDIPK
jgi:serine/threonine protein kinase